MDTQAHKKLKILLIGDSCTDEYKFGTCTRLSQEAPIPIFDEFSKFSVKGMAHNVKRNLEALGASVDIFTEDTGTKVRYIDERYKTQLFRCDISKEVTPLAILPSDYSIYDAIVISDYAKGSVTEGVVEELPKDIPIYVDTKNRDITMYRDCIIKINDIEFHSITEGLFSTNNIIITKGAEGAMTFPDGKVYGGVLVPEMVDVCGAGDTFLASLVYFHLTYKDLDSAIHIANKAASITVQHMGVYAPTLEEVMDVK